ncbi:hypothetical protein AXG93_4649s1000 [Marchantia polymorpha subsp. ruderalis]|uniref:Uncharacterized protein n=1 Tax=Marchantia polymorpha subsp. ruderalis TaxID=1480154 RepID=A0A176VGU4_MARPO|nr:hypothetical protein AXG93_4649s1000 [Marchantia polymorpha subsp. ruderalis]
MGHANTECTATRPSYPVNAVEWVPVWEPARYYTDTVEETAYAVAEAPTPTPITLAHIPSNYRKPGHIAAECPQQAAPRPTVRFVNPPSKDDVQVNQVTLSPKRVRPDEAWPSDDVIVRRVEIQSSTRRKEATRKGSKKEKRADARTAKEAKRSLKEQKNREPDSPVPKARETVEEQEVSGC